MPPRLFVLRHGRSLANERGLIASTVENAGEAFGLTDTGRDQVRETVAEAQEAGRLGAPIRVISSPLLRARESAEVAASLLGVIATVDDRLVERGFGDFELEPHDRYQPVWNVDRRDPTHQTWGVESVVHVLSRLRPLVEEVVRDNEAETVILVTHGDVASTLICAAGGVPLGQHREAGALDTGAMREVRWPRSGAPPIFRPESPDPAETNDT